MSTHWAFMRNFQGASISTVCAQTIMWVGDANVVPLRQSFGNRTASLPIHVGELTAKNRSATLRKYFGYSCLCSQHERNIAALYFLYPSFHVQWMCYNYTQAPTHHCMELYFSSSDVTVCSSPFSLRCSYYYMRWECSGVRPDVVVARHLSLDGLLPHI